MPPSLLFDLSPIDLEHVAYDVARIEAVNPQRGAMRHLDGVNYLDDPDCPSRAVAFKDVRDDEFWVEGHIPGRPLLPGVVMIEAAAQLAGFMTKLRRPDLGFIGFVGADEIKFRGQVVPGERLYILGQETDFRSRRFTSRLQGVKDGTIVFEATITGMAI